MSTVVFSTTFDIKDIFNDPQVKKALRDREDRYIGNMRWLDEDLETNVEEAESRLKKIEGLFAEEWGHRCVRDLSSLEETLDSRIARSEKARLRWRLALLHCGKFFTCEGSPQVYTKAWSCDRIKLVDEIPVEEEPQTRRVTVCKPCREYTHGQEKPKWAMHGCSKKKHKYKDLLSPQLPESERPKRWGSHIRPNGNGFSCIHPECKEYGKIYPKKQGAQQHAKKHYPPEYKCSDCDGAWYLKTQYNQHFLVPCPDCNEFFMKGSISNHRCR